MLSSKQALEKLKDIAIYEENNNRCSDLGDCCDFKGELVEVYEKEVNAIEKDLETLEQYKNIEEELGIDLITLFKALKDGVWTKRLFYDSEWRRYHTFEKANVIEKKPIAIKTICCPDWTFKNQHQEFVFEVQGSIFYDLRLRDYGKTWALTKEELKK